MFDLIVVGAGLSGLSAAFAAAKAGKKVKVIAKGLGALHWSAGTIDALGYFPDRQTAVIRPFETLPALLLSRPHHPYAITGIEGLGHALTEFLDLTHGMDLPYVGAEHAGANLWLPSPIGAARPSMLAPLAQLGGDLGNPDPMLIVGFSGLRDFYPALIAENLEKQGHTARPAMLPYELLHNQRDRTTVQIAGEMDKPARRERLAVELKRLVRPGERIGLPALMGLGDHSGVMEELAARTGTTVFEIPTMPPSVPGMRLHFAMTRALERLDVRVDVNMNVINFHAEGDRILWVETETSGHPLKHRAENFLLATGGILGGGIETDHKRHVRETALNLPVVLPEGEWLSPRFFDPEGQAIFRCGVAVDERFQPLDHAGARVYRNVYAAGTLLANADPIQERSLEGIALTTGLGAGRCAVGLSQTVPELKQATVN